jgi:hypothetical protein
VPEPDAGHDEGKDVLGNLPRRRPGIESSKRAKARTGRKKAEAAGARSKPAPEPAQRSDLEDLERLAKGGARLAAGVAGTGLKLAGRAVGGLGRVVGRR